MTSRDAHDPSRRDELIIWLLGQRLARGLSQKDVGERGGLSRNTIGTLESGKRGASVAMLRRYARGIDPRFRLEIVVDDVDVGS